MKTVSPQMASLKKGFPVPFIRQGEKSIKKELK